MRGVRCWISHPEIGRKQGAGVWDRLAQRLESNARAKFGHRCGSGRRTSFCEFCTAGGGLVRGLHLCSLRDCKIPDTSKPQRKDRRHASPRPGCKLQESRRLWTARKEWREIVRHMPCLQKWTHGADASPLVNPKKTGAFRRRARGGRTLVGRTGVALVSNAVCNAAVVKA